MLQLPHDPEDPERLARVKAALLAARHNRVQPGRDDKVVTAWNGLAITALAEAGVALSRPDLIDAARRCADSLLILHLVNGRLRRASLGGEVSDSPAILEDHGALATGLLTLNQVTGEASWLMAATDILDTAMAQFADPDSPGRWFDTAADAERLVLRPADPVDGATPSGASLLTEALMIAGHLAPDGERYRRAGAAGVGRAHVAARAGAAGSVALAGFGRSRGAWAAADRRGLRPRRLGVARAGARAGAWRGDRGRWRRRLFGAARRPRAGRRGATRLTCVAARCATCRSPRHRSSRRRWARACSVPSMPTVDDYAATVNRYLELLGTGSADEITALYTDDATIEDPVGSRRAPGTRRGSRVLCRHRKSQQGSRIGDAEGRRQRGRLLVALDGGCGRQPHQDRADQRDDVRRRREDHVDAGVLVAGRRGRCRVAPAGGQRQKTANHIAM